MPVTTNHFPGWGISVILDLTLLPEGKEFYSAPAGLTLIGALFIHLSLITMSNESNTGHILSFVQLPTSYLTLCLTEKLLFETAVFQSGTGDSLVLCSLFKTIFRILSFKRDSRRHMAYQATTVQHFSFQSPEPSAIHMLMENL